MLPDQAKAPGLPPGAVALSGQRELPSLEPLVRRAVYSGKT